MGEVVDTAINVATLGTVKTDLSGKKRTENALNAQTAATNQANAANDMAWARQQEEMAPWKAAGAKALDGLQDGSFFQKDAGYQARLDEGMRGINSGLAARGMGNSGAALKALTRFGQDYASNEYQNAYNRQNNLVNYGNQASMALGNFAGGYGANAANNAIGLGNANAAGQIGMANRDAGIFGSILSAGGQAAGAAMGGGGGKMSSPFSNLSMGRAQALPPNYGHNHWNQA